MAEHEISKTVIVTGKIIAQNVTFEQFMQDYVDQFAEWIDGKVIALSPVSMIHMLLTKFFIRLIEEYLDMTDEGLLMIAPFVMRVSPQSPAKEPDLHMVLKHRADIVKDTLTEGPADIAIEIVSLESTTRDRGEKFDEYESGGVKEYWLIDPLRKEALFYELKDQHYHPIALDGKVFRSTVLKEFQLDVSVLWQKNLPDAKHIRVMVVSMLGREG